MTPSLEQLEQTYRQTYRGLAAITFAYALLVVTAITLLIAHPKVGDWVSQAVQAEFGTANAPPSH
jgi:hypothetical protein